jgi:soluble lytic murein transglycosylase-like protein
MDRAIEFYCAAADRGYAEAYYRLGDIYATGRAGKVDEVQGAAWLKKALDAENAWARSRLTALGALDLDLGERPACLLSMELEDRRIPKTAPTTPKEQQDEAPPPAFAVRDLGRDDIKGLIRRLAPDYNLDPELVLAVVQTESNFNAKARSNKNAQGLMQLIPATAKRFGVKNVWDPLDNLRGGMAYLRWLLDHFNGDVELALAGYNAGENAVHKHGGIPPYPETQGYVKRITRKLNLDDRPAASSPLRFLQPPQRRTPAIGSDIDSLSIQNNIPDEPS